MNIIDLFCGCGGFSRGFEDAGFNVVMGLDVWADAIKTFNINHNNPTGICKNIYDFTNEEIIEFATKNSVRGIIGGPPCQGYSMVGTRDSDDERNTLKLVRKNKNNIDRSQERGEFNERSNTSKISNSSY